MNNANDSWLKDKEIIIKNENKNKEKIPFTYTYFSKLCVYGFIF